MSDIENPRREWRFYIEDMIGFAEKVLAYTEGIDQITFTDKGMTHDAVLVHLDEEQLLNALGVRLALATALFREGGLSLGRAAKEV